MLRPIRPCSTSRRGRSPEGSLTNLAICGERDRLFGISRRTAAPFRLVKTGGFPQIAWYDGRMLRKTGRMRSSSRCATEAAGSARWITGQLVGVCWQAAIATVLTAGGFFVAIVGMGQLVGRATFGIVQ
jgi:hypothetical protein